MVVSFLISFMFSIGSWNVWGLNNLQTQKTVHDWTTKNNLQLFGLLETKIAPANLDAVEANLCRILLLHQAVES